MNASAPIQNPEASPPGYTPHESPADEAPEISAEQVEAAEARLRSLGSLGTMAGAPKGAEDAATLQERRADLARIRDAHLKAAADLGSVLAGMPPGNRAARREALRTAGMLGHTEDESMVRQRGHQDRKKYPKGFDRNREAARRVLTRAGATAAPKAEGSAS